MKMRGKGEGEVPNRAEKQRKKAVGVDDSHNKPLSLISQF
jgi:hypothetical protein